MDRNDVRHTTSTRPSMSLSARRAWIEIPDGSSGRQEEKVALRKESVDRNICPVSRLRKLFVALRKESVDRNARSCARFSRCLKSLSARRAWIEILPAPKRYFFKRSLSARRAWIEIFMPLDSEP